MRVLRDTETFERSQIRTRAQSTETLEIEWKVTKMLRGKKFKVELNNTNSWWKKLRKKLQNLKL